MAKLNQNSTDYDYKMEVFDQLVVPTSDEALLLKVAKGDEEAFGELYHRYEAPLFNYLLRLVNEKTVAEDLLQEVFVAAWNGAASFKRLAKVKTWLFRIAHNQAVSWLRSHHQVLAIEEVVEVQTGDNLEEQVMVTHRNERIRAALDQLSADHRAVIELAFFYDLSYTEIAAIVGCPVGTVKSRMSYARRYLSNLLMK